MPLSLVFVFLQIKPIMLPEYEKYILILTEKKICCFFTLPRSCNNKLPDQLAFSIKSYTLCSKPERRIIEGIIVALRWREVAD